MEIRPGARRGRPVVTTGRRGGGANGTFAARVAAQGSLATRSKTQRGFGNPLQTELNSGASGGSI